MGNCVTSGPNEAIIRSGCCQTGCSPFAKKGANMIIGGSMWVCACFQFVQRLPVSAITIEIKSEDVNSQRGVSVCALGVAQIKIGSQEECLKVASTLYCGKNNAATVRMIKDVAKQTLEGHQRAVIGDMTVEDMFRDKVKFSDQVYESASADLLRLGLTIVSYTLKDLSDNNGYLRALGQTEIAQTQARQKIAEAINKREADCKKAEANQLQRVAEFEAELEICQANLGLELKKADNLKDIATQKAKADLAERLQDAITRQEVIEQEMQTKVVERQREIKVQEEEIKRVEQQLQSTCIKPAEAAVYKMTKDAEAERKKIIAEAEAEADTVRMRGDAEAFAIRERAKAEAEQIKKKAAAFNQYKDAALMDVVLKVMPQVAAEVAAPINSVKKINMIASGDGEIGARRVTNEVMTIMERIPQVVENMTGIDISKDLKQLTGNK